MRLDNTLVTLRLTDTSLLRKRRRFVEPIKILFRFNRLLCVVSSDRKYRKGWLLDCDL